jgi:hypothetical protein
MFPGRKAAHGGGFGGFATSSTTLSYLTPPPDFSGIPQDVVVPFKNLLKKAGTTKEKALQDILGYVQGLPPNGQVLEEAIIDAYVGQCPLVLSTRRAADLFPGRALPEAIHR